MDNRAGSEPRSVEITIRGETRDGDTATLDSGELVPAADIEDDDPEPSSPISADDVGPH